jgi:hypothetical protein
MAVIKTTGVTLGPRIGPLAAINPNDIESIEILKDASATANLWIKRCKWGCDYYNQKRQGW